MKNNKNGLKFIIKVAFYSIAIAYAFVTVFPFLWSVLTSLKPTSEMNTLSINLSSLTFNNYTTLWQKFPFGRWVLNSIIVGLGVTFGNMLFNSMAGYALARIRFPGRNALFMAILAVMMVPGQIVLVPSFILLSKLGWVNTYHGMTIPFLVNCFNIFLMRQFFLSIPKSIEESAQIDGLGRFGIFFKIVLPLTIPALSTQFILTFTGNWNSFLWPSLLAQGTEMYTLPVGLNSFYGQYYQFWNQVLAGVMILTAPALIVFMVFQKNFIKGISTTGMKE